MHFVMEFLINGRITLVEFLARGQRKVKNFRHWREDNGVKVWRVEQCSSWSVMRPHCLQCLNLKLLLAARAKNTAIWELNLEREMLSICTQVQFLQRSEGLRSGLLLKLLFRIWMAHFIFRVLFIH